MYEFFETEPIRKFIYILRTGLSAVLYRVPRSLMTGIAQRMVINIQPIAFPSARRIDNQIRVRGTRTTNAPQYTCRNWQIRGRVYMYTASRWQSLTRCVKMQSIGAGPGPKFPHSLANFGDFRNLYFRRQGRLRCDSSADDYAKARRHPRPLNAG